MPETIAPRSASLRGEARGYPSSMWTAFLIAFAALAVVGSLALGWPIIIAVLIALIAVGFWGVAAVFHRAREKPGPPTPGSSRPRDISEVRDPAEAGPAETPHSTR